MSDLVTSRIFVDGEKGITAAKLNDIVASSVIQPAFYTSKPTAGTADPTDIALILKSGAYAQVPISTLGGSATQAQIWSTRLRSFNSVGNPSFEVDQINVGNLVANQASGKIQDRWIVSKTGTLAVSAQRIGAAWTNPIVVPGTNFVISNNYLRVTLTTAQASLGSTDNLQFFHNVEGPLFRELSFDVHSISLLVRSSVAGLNFVVSLRDTAGTRSLIKICTIPTAGIWTLITLPNLPVWPSAGTFGITPGVVGYYFNIGLAMGANLIAPAADTWQTGNFLGAPGMSNFAASPVNSTFDVAFVQHEAGSVCSTLMDKPFTQNLDECLRYYQKSYAFGTKAGTVTDIGARGTVGLGNPWLAASFVKLMAKAPTVTFYSNTTGTANNIRDNTNSVDRAGSAYNPADSGIPAIVVTGAPATAWNCQYHYTADTGW